MGLRKCEFGVPKNETQGAGLCCPQPKNDLRIYRITTIHTQPRTSATQPAAPFLNRSATMTKPKYLTGDNAAIEEFIDRFDVRG
jgi:hypothetical protein